MKTNNILDIKRLGFLLRRQIFSNGKSMMIALVGVSGIMLFITLLVGFFNPTALNSLHHLYFTAMFIGGYIFTSNIYAELYPVHRSYHYLTLPVSVTERLLSGWIISGILYSLIALLIIGIIVLLSNLILSIALVNAPVQTLLLKGALKTTSIYLITQTIFLLGAAYFKKNNFLKTILALFLFTLALQIFVTVFGYLLFGSFSATDGQFTGVNFSDYQLENLFLTHIPKASRFIYYWLLGPFLLVTTWFCLKEREV